MEYRIKELERKVEELEKNLVESVKTQAMLVTVIETLSKANQKNSDAIMEITEVLTAVYGTK